MTYAYPSVEDVLDKVRRLLSDYRAAGGKAHFVAAVSSDLVERGLHAGKLIGQVARVAGGGGGGQPHKAQAGGKQPDKVPEAIGKVPELVREAL